MDTAPVDAPVIGDFASEVLRVPLAAGDVEVVRPAHLARYVDGAQLLGAGDVAEPPYWMHLWPGALALARRLEQDDALAARTRVLELGCGLALPSLVAARRGCLVTAGDWKREPLRFAAASAARNALALNLIQTEWAHLAARPLFSLCIGADVAYDAGAQAALAAALRRAAAPRARLILADSVNTHRDDLIRRLAADGWEVRVERACEEEEGHKVWVRIIAARRPGI